MSEFGPLEYFVCGGVGGIFAVLTGHPLDTVKVKLQTMPKPLPGEEPLFAGMVDCIKKTYQKEGFTGLYKGMAVPLVTLAPIFAISFMGYKIGKQLLVPPDQKCTYTDYFMAGSFAGILTTFVSTPSERIKCLLQIQENSKTKKYDGPKDAAIKLFREGGLRNIYKGTLATLMRDVPAGAVYYLSYEVVKSYLTDSGRKSITLSGTVLAGGCAGLCNWMISMPADVVKTKLQTAPENVYPHGARDVVLQLYKEEGVLGFYRGLVPGAVRAFPANAACFLGFELSKMVIKQVFPSQKL